MQEAGAGQVAGGVVNAMLHQIGGEPYPLAEQSEGSSGRSREKAVAEADNTEQAPVSRTV